MRNHRPLLSLALLAAVAGAAVAASAQVPQIAKPRRAPPGPSTMPPLPPAAFDPKLAIGGNDIKTREVETRMTVEVRVNGAGPYHFLVDSGADTSVVGLKIAQALQLPLGRPALLNAMTSRNIVDRVKVDELSLGQSRIRDLEVPALKEGDLGGDGMLGIDALVNQRLMMDFETNIMKIEDAIAVPFHPTGDEIVITARRQHGQLILTEVVAAGLPLDAVIDTGSEITIGNLALRDKLVRHNRDKFFTVPTTGVTGKTMDLELAVIGELKLGRVTLRNVPMAFADLPPFKVFGLADQPALLLGTDILENFRRVSLDFRARKVRFQLRRCGTTGITLNSSPTATLTRLSSDDDSVCQR
jgi:hypothetical protein